MGTIYIYKANVHRYHQTDRLRNYKATGGDTIRRVYIVAIYIYVACAAYTHCVRIMMNRRQGRAEQWTYAEFARVLQCYVFIEIGNPIGIQQREQSGKCARNKSETMENDY